MREPRTMSGWPSRLTISGDDSRKPAPGIVRVHLAVSAVPAAAAGVARVATVAAVAVRASAMTATIARSLRVGETVIGTAGLRWSWCRVCGLDNTRDGIRAH